MWLLVEWADKRREVFPSYRVIKKKYVVDEELKHGKIVRVRNKHNKKKRRARILMISESKGKLQNEKDTLKTRDSKVKAILSKCVRKCRKNSSKINRAKTPEPVLVESSPEPPKPQLYEFSPEPRVVECLPEPELVDCLPGPSKICMLRSPRIPDMPTSPSTCESNPHSPIVTHDSSTSSTSSSSSTNTEGEWHSNYAKYDYFKRKKAKFKRKLKRLKSRPSVNRSRSRSPHARKQSSTSRNSRLSNHQKLRSRSTASATPLPTNRKKPPRIFYDMFTQTDPDAPTSLHKPTVEFFALFVKELYTNFLQLIKLIEEMEARLRIYERTPQKLIESNSSDAPRPEVIPLPDPQGNRNENLVDILKGLNVNVELVGENSQDSDENQNSDNNDEDLDENDQEQELAENGQNLDENAQDSEETNQDSDDDDQESDDNDQDSDDDDQDSEDNDENVDVNDQMGDFDFEIPRACHILDVNDQIAAGEEDMREIFGFNHDLDDNMQVVDEDVPNAPIVVEYPQNVDDNVQMMDVNEPEPIVNENPQNEDGNVQRLGVNVPMPVVPVPEAPALPVPEAPALPVPEAPVLPMPEVPVVPVVPAVPVLPVVPVMPVFAEPRQPSPKPRKLEVRRVSAQSTVHGEPSNLAQRCIYGDEDMVAIGHNRTMIPRRLMNDINWSNYSTATRQLLQAVFPRRVLATHSLSGKQSPAFINHPRKEALDPRIVDDIVNTVCDRCGVEKSWVRVVITTKCTDEAKMYRNRIRQNRNNRNDENQDIQEPGADPAPAEEEPLDDSD